MYSGRHLSEKDKEFLKELYKCHFTIQEAMDIIQFSYNTVRMYYHGFGMMEVEKYDRMNLMSQEVRDDAECNTKQAAAC